MRMIASLLQWLQKEDCIAGRNTLHLLLGEEQQRENRQLCAAEVIPFGSCSSARNAQLIAIRQSAKGEKLQETELKEESNIAKPAPNCA